MVVAILGFDGAIYGCGPDLDAAKKDASDPTYIGKEFNAADEIRAINNVRHLSQAARISPDSLIAIDNYFWITCTLNAEQKIVLNGGSAPVAVYLSDFPVGPDDVFLDEELDASVFDSASENYWTADRRSAYQRRKELYMFGDPSHNQISVYTLRSHDRTNEIDKIKIFSRTVRFISILLEIEPEVSSDETLSWIRIGENFLVSLVKETDRIKIYHRLWVLNTDQADHARAWRIITSSDELLTVHKKIEKQRYGLIGWCREHGLEIEEIFVHKMRERGE